MTLRLRHQPVAGDLRRISTAMKVVTDIERIGDHAADIAEIIPHLVTVRKEGDPAVSRAIAMGKKAHQMILDALDALTAEDENAARRVIAADDEVDYDFNAIKHQLAQEIAEDPGKVDAALDLLMVIKYLERIGDQASDIAELVLHLHATSTDAVGVLEDILKMGDDVLKMVKRSIAAYVQVDLAVAAEVIAHDDVIDASFARISSEIAQYIAAHPTEAETALDLFMVTKYLERLGDHAVNVAEWVEFLKTGVHKSRKIV